MRTQRPPLLLPPPTGHSVLFLMRLCGEGEDGSVEVLGEKGVVFFVLDGVGGGVGGVVTDGSCFRGGWHG